MTTGFERFTPDLELQDGQSLRAMGSTPRSYLPGHTPGSICLLLGGGGSSAATRWRTGAVCIRLASSMTKPHWPRVWRGSRRWASPRSTQGTATRSLGGSSRRRTGSTARSMVHDSAVTSGLVVLSESTGQQNRREAHQAALPYADRMSRRSKARAPTTASSTAGPPRSTYRQISAPLTSGRRRAPSPRRDLAPGGQQRAEREEREDQVAARPR